MPCAQYVLYSSLVPETIYMEHAFLYSLKYILVAQVRNSLSCLRQILK